VLGARWAAAVAAATSHVVHAELQTLGWRLVRYASVPAFVVVGVCVEAASADSDMPPPLCAVVCLPCMIAQRLVH
jgi:hypothetical protein